MSNKRSTTLHSSGATIETVKIGGDEHLKITLTGINNKNYISTKRDYSKTHKVVLYLPIWFLPSFMRDTRKALGEWRKKHLDEIKRIENSFTAGIPEPE